MDTPVDSDNSANSPKKRAGCGCLPILAAIAVIATAIGIWSYIDERGVEKISMGGVVSISEVYARGTVGSNCLRGGYELSIGASGQSRAVLVPLENGFRDADGSCRFAFRVSVPVADSYRFEIPTQGGDTFPSQRATRSQIDTVGPGGRTELSVELSW